MRQLLGVALIACLIIACGSTPPARMAAPARTAAPAGTVGLRGASAAPAGAPYASPEGPPAPPSRCRLTVTETEGCGAQDVEAIVAPVRPRLESCRGAGGGKLRIRVRKAGGKLGFDVEPGPSLDPSQRRCVLDALATINADESSTAWTGLNVRPTGFTSLITIEW